MSIKTQLENDTKDAMRSKDEFRKRTLRMALAAIKQAEIDGGSSLDETALMALIQKEIKSRNEAIADAQRARRSDLVETNQAEIEILKAYLPQPLTTAELDELARQAVAEAGATSVREMGQVMKILMPHIQGRATGNEVSQAVRKLLA